MDCFDYPIDEKYLLRKKKQIQRELCKSENLMRKRIAVLGGSTTNELVDQLNNFLLNYGIDASFYQSNYAMYWQDAMFGNKELDEFNPDVIFIHTSWRNIRKFPQISDTMDNVDSLLDEEYQSYELMWQSIRGRYHCPIIQNNFDRPNYRLMGNRDIWDYRGRSNYTSRLNQLFYFYAQNHEDFYINDLEYLSQDYGLSEWNNDLYWYMYKYAMCIGAIPHVAQSVANIIKSIYGKNKKVLALDLDNTLWGGVVGDDGVEGIKIGPEGARGQVYAEFQEYCKKLKDIGVILVINSKNDYENAIAGLNHPNGIIRPKDFANIKANWNSKDKNLIEIADELCLNLDSFVFIDDNPAERAMVSLQLPCVESPTFCGEESFIRVLDHSGYFEVTALSAEDQNKTEMYKARAEAVKKCMLFSNYDEYLEDLGMTAKIEDFNKMNIQRIAQLTNKTNQFNLTTLRCSESDIERMQNSEEYICLCGRLKDKYMDNGLVTALVGQIKGDELHIILWVMSCRVLKRGVEDIMMNAIFEKAKERGLKKIVGHYYPTIKNGIVNKLYDEYGFNMSNEGENRIGFMLLTCYQKRTSHISVLNDA